MADEKPRRPPDPEPDDERDDIPDIPPTEPTPEPVREPPPPEGERGPYVVWASVRETKGTR